MEVAHTSIRFVLLGPKGMSEETVGEGQHLSVLVGEHVRGVYSVLFSLAVKSDL